MSARTSRAGLREHGAGADALAADRARPAGAGLLAHVLVGKYCDHLPLYRQSGIYAREGVDLDRSTLADWVGKAAWLGCSPLVEAVGRACHGRREAARRRHAGAGAGAGHRQDQDRTAMGLCPRRTTLWRASPAGGRLPLLARSQGRASARPSGELPRHPPGRRLCRLRRALSEPGRTSGGHAEVACWAHVRRKFFDVHLAANGSPIAARGARAHRPHSIDVERRSGGSSSTSTDPRARM